MLFWSSQFKLDCRDNVNLIIISRGHFLKWIFWRCLKCLKRPLPSTTPLPATEHTNLSEPLSTNFYFHVYQISYPSQGPTPQPPTPSPDISQKKLKKNSLHPLVKDTPYNAMNNDEKLTIYLLSMHLSMFP